MNTTMSMMNNTMATNVTTATATEPPDFLAGQSEKDGGIAVGFVLSGIIFVILICFFWIVRPCFPGVYFAARTDDKRQVCSSNCKVLARTGAAWYRVQARDLLLLLLLFW
jgi:hypothetical protein